MAIIIVALVILGAILMRVNSKYDTLLGAENISDLSAKIGDLKNRANANFVSPADSISLPKDLHIITTTGMPVTYTVSREANQYRHHIALSSQGTYFAHSAGMTLAAWLAHFLDVPSAKFTVPATAGDGRVRHIVFTLDENEQSDFSAKAVRVVNKEQVTQDLWKQILQEREAIVANSLPNKT